MKDSAFSFCSPFMVSCIALDAESLDKFLTFVLGVLTTIPRASVADTIPFVSVWRRCS